MTTQESTRSAIASLAILKVNWDKLGRDYIENFVPIVTETVRTGSNDVISLPDLQAELRTQFSLDIPLNPLRIILQRLRKNGYLKLENGVFYRDRQACEQLNFREVEERVSGIHDRVVSKLQHFAHAKYQMEWSQGESETALLSFIAHDGLDVLFSVDTAQPITHAEKQAGGKYVVTAFIEQARLTDQQGLEDIETLIKGHLLANALFLPDPHNLAQKFKSTTVFFDTSFLIYACGYGGKDRQAPCRELLDLLVQYGANLACFRMTLSEVQGVLSACADRIKNGQFKDTYAGSSVEYFLETGYQASDIELIVARLPTILNTLGIHVWDKPPYVKEYQIDERALEELLQSGISYRHRGPLLHDVDCLSAVFRLRKGRHSPKIESSTALFVTTNISLARLAKQFFSAESKAAAAPLCISDGALGNLLWLKNPTKAPDLPLKRLIADAYAAMQPPEALWKSYLMEIVRLEESGKLTADDYYLLRHSLTAKTALMQMTRGDVQAFTEGTVPEILELVKQNLRADLQRELEEERHKRASVEEAFAVLEDKERLRLKNITASVTRLAKFISFLICLGVAASLLLGSLVTFPWSLPAFSSAKASYIKSGSLAVLFVFGIVSMIWGTSVSGIYAWLNGMIAKALIRITLNWLGDSQSTRTD